MHVTLVHHSQTCCLFMYLSVCLFVLLCSLRLLGTPPLKLKWLFNRDRVYKSHKRRKICSVVELMQACPYGEPITHKKNICITILLFFIFSTAYWTLNFSVDKTFHSVEQLELMYLVVIAKIIETEQLLTKCELSDFNYSIIIIIKCYDLWEEIVFW